MNISRNVLLAALVTLTLPVISGQALQNQTEGQKIQNAPKIEQNADLKNADKTEKKDTPQNQTEGQKIQNAPKIEQNADLKNADKTEKKDTAETEKEKSFSGKVCAFIAAPFVLTGNGAMYAIKTIAKYGGAKTIVRYLASASKDKDGKDLEKGTIATFFTNHGSKVQNTLVLVEVAALLYVANEVYKKFVVESEDNEDEYADVEFVDFANDN